jgi:hypothetical protein
VPLGGASVLILHKCSSAHTRYAPCCYAVAEEHYRGCTSCVHVRVLRVQAAKWAWYDACDGGVLADARATVLSDVLQHRPWPRGTRAAPHRAANDVC